MATRTVERAAVRLWPAHVRVGALPLLAGMVAASFVLRTVLGWLRATPTFFSDEYIYSELGRSIAETGQPLIRGATANFPALLQPVLTAPAWLANDIEVSFRIIQALGSAAMSLAAVPVFLLARRLGLGQGMALALAALALAVPDMLYSSWVVAEPFAYPLLLAAVAAGTAALTAPRKRTQLLFLLLAGLTAFARIQFVVLPLCYAGAVVALGLRERSSSSSPPSPSSCWRRRARAASSGSTGLFSTSTSRRRRWRSGSASTRCSSSTSPGGCSCQER